MLFLGTIKTIFYFCFILILLTKITLSEVKYSKEEIIQQSRLIKLYTNNSKNCFSLNTLKLEESGFVTLHFTHNDKYNSYGQIRNIHKSKCPENVLYDVKVFKSHLLLQ